MKLVVSLADLKRAIALPVSAVPSNSPIPIATHLRLVAAKDNLRILGTSFEMWAEDGCAAEVETEGRCTVPAKLFQSFVANGIPGSQISLSLEKQTLVARCGRLSARMPTLPAEDFPDAPPVEDARAVVFTSEAVKMALKRTAFAACKEQARYYLCGVHLKRVGDNIEWAATDGVMLGRVRMPVKDPGLKFDPVTLPNFASAAILKLLSSADEGADVRLDIGRLVRLTFKSAVITTRIVDGAFPDHDRIVPKSFQHDLVFGRDEFLSALDRVAPFDTERTSTILLHARKGALELAAGTREQAAREEIDCVYAGGGVKFAVRVYALKSIVSAMPLGEIGLRIVDPGSPMVFSPSDDSQDIWVAAPYAAHEIAEAA